MDATPQDMVRLVERYFAAVDRKDIDGTLAVFTPDAEFTIATFDTVYRGRDGGIRGMFERLFARYDGVWHGNFRHVVEPPHRIASRFDVENRTADGQVSRKHNANFFVLRDGLFSEVAVYMSGDNSLR